MAKLSPRHRAFVREYVKDKNATRAYRAVYGVGQKVAENTGPRLLGNARVREAVDAQLARLEAKLEISAERVLRNIADIANSASKRTANKDKLKANELLGKHLKLFTEVTESKVQATLVTVSEEQAKAVLKKLNDEC